MFWAADATALGGDSGGAGGTTDIGGATSGSEDSSGESSPSGQTGEDGSTDDVAHASADDAVVFWAIGGMTPTTETDVMGLHNGPAKDVITTFNDWRNPDDRSG
jgi:hypothetical protein